MKDRQHYNVCMLRIVLGRKNKNISILLKYILLDVGMMFLEYVGGNPSIKVHGR